jgi:phosphoribosylformimino-5-aminoimidazole carboxamide ribotide isomerase
MARLHFFICLPKLSKGTTGLKVIPVIDVLNGVAVHAVRGNRKEYQPLKSGLTESVNPIEVAKDFKKLGFSELYLADLDAILRKKPDIALYSRIVDQTGLKLMVDAGVTDIETGQKLQNGKVSKIIIGTETLQTQAFINEAVKQVGANHLIVSIDMKDGKVLTLPSFDGPTDALKLLSDFHRLGVSEFILLDLARVGSGEGVNLDFLKQALILGAKVYVGGGVSSIEELVELKTLGVSGVLFATALHAGKVSTDSLRRAGLL